MSFSDDKFGTIFPTRNGNTTGSANERSMLDKFGGASGFRTEIRNNADGSTTMLRTRNGMPEFETKKPEQPSVASGGKWVPPHGLWWSETGNITTESGDEYSLQGDVPTQTNQRGAGTCWQIKKREKSSKLQSLRTPLRQVGNTPYELVTGTSGRFNFNSTGQNSWVHVDANTAMWGFYVHHVFANVETGILDFDVVKRSLDTTGAPESETHVSISMGLDQDFRTYAGYEFERTPPYLLLAVEDSNSDGSKCLFALYSEKIIRSTKHDAPGEVAGALLSRYLFGVLECTVGADQTVEFRVVHQQNELWPEATVLYGTPIYRVIAWKVNNTSHQGELIYDSNVAPVDYYDPTFTAVAPLHYTYASSTTLAIGARYSIADVVEVITMTVDSTADYNNTCNFNPTLRNIVETSNSTLAVARTYTIRAGQAVIYTHTDSAQVTGSGYRDLAYRDSSGAWYGSATIEATYSIAGFQGSLSFSHTVAGDVNSPNWDIAGYLHMFYADGFAGWIDYDGSYSRGYIFNRSIVGYAPITRLLPPEISNLHYYVPIRYSNSVYGLVGGLLHEYEPNNFLVFTPAVGKIGKLNEIVVWAHGFKKYYPQHATEHPVTGEVVRRDKPVCWV